MSDAPWHSGGRLLVMQWFAGMETIQVAESSPARLLVACRRERIRRALAGLPCGWLTDHERLRLARMMRGEENER